MRAFRRAFEAGHGIELDVRDHEGRAVVSHDPARGGATSLEDVLALSRAIHGAGTIAINVKADGLQALIAEALKTHGVDDYFVFDMSIPDLIGYRKRGLRFFARQSDVEPVPQGIQGAAGIWIDGFEKDWYDFHACGQHLAKRLELAFVSPELHGREHLAYWQALRGWLNGAGPGADRRIWLCTDFPDDARTFFDVND